MKTVLQVIAVIALLASLFVNGLQIRNAYLASKDKKPCNCEEETQTTTTETTTA
jgi:hypothetical protein